MDSERETKTENEKPIKGKEVISVADLEANAKAIDQIRHDMAQLALCVEALNQRFMQATAPKIIRPGHIGVGGFAPVGQKPRRRIHVHIDKDGTARVIPPIGSKVC